MNNLQDTLLFPVRDAQARSQFLFACLIGLAGFIVPILPWILLTGYTAKIMRQVIEERKDPSMPEWQGSDWSAMLVDGIRLYGTQLVLSLPLFAVIFFGMFAVFGGSTAMTIGFSEGEDWAGSLGLLFFLGGIGFFLLFSLLSLPYTIIISAAGPHVVSRNSFEAAFQFKEWWGIFRKGMGQFILAYAVSMALSFVLMFAMQVAMMTIVLICVVPFIMIPYSTYITLLMNTLYAQAYCAGKDALEKA